MIAFLLFLSHKASAAPNFEACGTLPDNSLDIPGGVAILHLHASGTRNYTCSSAGGPAIIGDNQGEVLAKFNLESNASQIVGNSYTTPEGQPIYVVDFPAQGLFGKVQMERSIADDRLGPSPTFQPSPTNGSIPWARWRTIPSTGEGSLENVTYVTRFDTEGGEKPVNCPMGKKTAEVPFKAGYTFFTCGGSASSGASTKPRLFQDAIVLLTTLASIVLT